MNSPVSYTEQELVALLKAREESAYNYLYDHYADALYGIILQIVADDGLSGDVLQEVFVNIWRKIHTYDESKGRLFTWMLNVARNLAIDMVRSKAYQNIRRSRHLSDATIAEGEGLSLTPAFDGIGLKKAVERLKPEHRSLIDLAYFRGYTHEEIATEAQIPLGTVKTRIRSALLQLREYLK